jgi:mRNA interferase YafQ
MKELIVTNNFKKDLQIMAKRGSKMQKLMDIIMLLRLNQNLSNSCRPHKLQGNYKDYWECHISPDWLLIYQFDDKKRYAF